MIKSIHLKWDQCMLRDWVIAKLREVLEVTAANKILKNHDIDNSVWSLGTICIMCHLTWLT